jgi:hypothetical protein
MPEPSKSAGPATSFAYFILRMRRASPTDSQGFSGVVERLGTGDKRSFESGDELLRLLNSLARDGGKMP